jgi:hypothetical protein
MCPSQDEHNENKENKEEHEYGDKNNVSPGNGFVE